MRVALYILRIFPAALARWCMQCVAALAFVIGIRRKIALNNLEIAFPELRAGERLRLAWRNYLHLGTSAADFLRSPGLSDQEILGQVDSDDLEKVEPYLSQKKGIILCTAHMGNFEFFGIYASRRQIPLSILTRPLKGVANALWVHTRTSGGVREIHRGMDNLVNAVKEGRVMAILIDQNMLLKRAVFVPFFGKLAATTPAPAVVAERTDAPVFLGLMLRKADRRFRIVLEGPFFFQRTGERAQDILHFTAMLNERFERYVKQYPEQWFWLHRRWKTQPTEVSGDLALEK